MVNLYICYCSSVAIAVTGIMHGAFVILASSLEPYQSLINMTSTSLLLSTVKFNSVGLLQVLHNVRRWV